MHQPHPVESHGDHWLQKRDHRRGKKRKQRWEERWRSKKKRRAEGDAIGSQTNNLQGVFEKCMEHIRFATNRGNIITTMTVFAQQKAGQVGPRIWNTQLLRYPLLHIPYISFLLPCWQHRQVCRISTAWWLGDWRSMYVTSESCSSSSSN